MQSQQNQQLEKAIEEYQVALAIDPNYVEAHNNLGVAYGTLGKFS